MQKHKILKNKKSYSKIIGVSIIALFMLMAAVSAVVLFATPAEAQEPGVTKWLQTPDLSPNGLDVDATAPIELLADDFLCEGTGPITDVHIWGSWLNDYLPFGDIYNPSVGDPAAVAFTLSIHADIPDPDPGNPETWSMPGELLWIWTFGPDEFDTYAYEEGLMEGYYNPCTGEYIPSSVPADTVCWQYNFWIDPTDAFIQQQGNIYWLDVQAQPLDEYARFGWKTSVDHWNDDAVYACGMEGDHGPWVELIYPYGHPLEGQSIDLAFEITTSPCFDDVPPTLDDAIFTDDMYPPNWYDQEEDPDGYATMQVNWTEDNPVYVEITVDGIGTYTDNSPSGGISIFNIPISGEPDGDYAITYEIKDVCENYDTTVSGTDDEPLRLDSTGPVQTVEFGDPNETYHGTFEDYFVVGPNTPIRIISDDGTGVGSKELHYYVQWGDTFQNCPHVSVPQKIVLDNDNTGDPYTTDIDPTPGRIVVEIYEDESCWHQIHYYCIDLLDNRQPEGTAEHWTDFIVDADAPEYQIEYEGPNFGEADGWTWIGNCTKKWINVTDIGCGDYYVSGADKVDWYIYNVTGDTFDLWLDGVIDDWDGTGDIPEGRCVDLNPVDGEINFWINVPGDCKHYICWRVYDDLGNYDVDLDIPTPNKEKNMVDVTPPISYLDDYYLDPACFIDEYEYCVTTGTLISIYDENVGMAPCIFPGFWTSFRIYVEDEDQWYPDENGNGNYDVYGASAERFYWEGVWYYIYTGPFHFTEECNHTLEFFAKDALCNTEEKHVYLFHVDDQYPVIIKTIHAPNYIECDNCANDLTNPGFETGDFNGWHVDYSTDSVTVVTADGFTSPYTGTYMARLGDDNGGVSGYQIPGPNQISQLFTVTQNTFAFAYNIFTYDYIGLNHFEYKLETADGTTIAYYSQGAWGPDDDTSLKSTGWTVVAMDISNFMGQQLKFTVNCGGTEDDILSTWAYIDCAPDTGIFVTPDTVITIDAADMGCCDELEYVGYKVNDDEWVEITGNLPFGYWFGEECVHILKIKARDCLGHETIHTETFYVDGTPPIHSKEVGQPNCTSCCGMSPGDYCITPTTPIWINATDDGIGECIVGSYHIHWAIWNATTWQLYDSGVSHSQNVTLYIGETCRHVVGYWVEDNLGNRWPPLPPTGDDDDDDIAPPPGDDDDDDDVMLLPDAGWHTETFYVDDTYPEIDKIVTTPNCPNPDGANFCVRTTTAIYFKAWDDGCCPCPIVFEYRVWNDIYDSGWTNAEELTLITVGPHSGYYLFKFDTECFHHLDLRAYDCLGHITYDYETFYVDNQAPELVKSVGEPNCTHDDCGCIGEGDYCVTTDTLITLGYIDHGCCPSVITIEYMIELYNETTTYWDLLQDWTVYTVPFNFAEECKHRLTVRVYDCLDNGYGYHDVEIFYVDNPDFEIKKIVGIPQCSSSDPDVDFCVTTGTPIELKLLNTGCCPCPVYFEYRVWNDTYDSGWLNVYDLSQGDCGYYIFTFDDECFHHLDLRAYDCFGYIVYDNETFYVDNQAPFIDKQVLGDDVIDRGGGDYSISCDTIIRIDAWDLGCCDELDYVEYKYFFEGYWYGPYVIFDAAGGINELPKEIQFAESCVHELVITARDCLGNEIIDTEIFYVDCTPPTSTKSFSGNTYPEDLNGNGTIDNDEELYYWLRDNHTVVKIHSVDEIEPCDVGVDYLHVELWISRDGYGATWEQVWSEDIYDGDPINDTDGTLGEIGYKFKIMEDCLHKIVWYAVDLFGNTETEHVQYHRVDSQPPETIKTIGEPKWWDEEKGLWWVTSETQFTLTSVDTIEPCAVGVDYLNVLLEYSCDNITYAPAQWITIYDNKMGDLNPEQGIIVYNFTLPLECYWRITWYAVDYLGNGEDQEDWHVQYHIVDNTPPHVIILKPTDGWYSDGETIPSVVFSEDMMSLHSNCGMGYDCAVGIEEGQQGYAWLIDIFPEPKIINLTTDNFVYNQTSHEYIGNVIIPENTGINGTALFVAGSADRLGNDWTSIHELIHAYIIQAISECVFEDEACVFSLLSDWLADFITNQNIVFVGIDNVPPEIDITLPLDGADVGLGPIHLEADIADVLSGVVTGTPCYVTLDGISIGTLYYDSSIGGCVGDLSIPLDIGHGPRELTVAVADRAGCLGSDTIIVIVGKRPGPLATAVDVQPDPSMIMLNGDGEILTVTGTIQSIYPGRHVDGAEYFIQIGKPDEAVYGTGIPMNADSGYSWGMDLVDVIATFDSTGMDPGMYTVWVHGVDQYGSWGTFDEEEFNLVLETHWKPIYCEIVSPDEDEEFTVECGQRYVEVEVDVHYWDDWTYSDMTELISNVKVWLDSPYGAPDQYYDVEYNRYGGHHFWADIPIYMYSDDSLLDIEAKAQDQYGNKEYDDVQINVFTTVVYDQWMEMEWNSLTLPYGAIACDNDVESVLASINNGNFDVVFHYDGTGWTSYAYGIPGDTLTEMFTGEEYWVHIVGEPVRFYTDTNAPTLWITDPSSEYTEKCEGPYHLDYEVCELETWTVMTYTQIYDQNGTYWNGNSWQESPIWLECEYDGEDDGYTFWKYCSGCDDGIWTPGHTYDISAYAVDAAGCESEIVTHTLHIHNPSIYVEKTVNGQEELIIPINTEFTFSIYIENDGDIEIYYVDLYDYLPYDLIYMDSATVSYNGEPAVPYEYDDDDDTGDELVYMWYLDSLEPGEYLILEFNATVTSCETWEENIVEVYGETMCDPVDDTDNAFVYGECNCIEFIACVDGSDWVVVENGMLSIYHNDHDPIGSSDNCEDWPDYCGFISIDGAYHYIELPPGEDQYLIDGAPFLPVGIENLDLFFQLSGRGDVSWEEPYVIYIDDDSYGGGDLYTILLCGDPNDCIPSVDLEKTVWREDMGYWDEYTEVEIGDTVRFNISIHIPEDGCPLFGGVLEDYLPYGLDYVEGSTNMTFVMGDYYEHFYGSEYDPEQIPDDDYMILRWGESTGDDDDDDSGGGGLMFPGMWMYIEFEALVTDCGDYTNTANITTYYDCCTDVSDEDDADVYVECCEPDIGLFKQVRVACGEGQSDDWSDSVTAEVEDIVGYNISVWNYVECCDVTDLVVRDELLSSGLEFWDSGPFQATVVFNGEELVRGYHYTVEYDGQIMWVNFTDNFDIVFHGLKYGDTLYIYLYAMVTECHLDMENYAEVNGDCDGDSVFDFDSAFVDCEEACVPDWSIEKYTWCNEGPPGWTVDRGTGLAEQPTNNASFKLNFTNTGSCDITQGIQISDMLPDEYTYDDGSYVIDAPAGITFDGFNYDTDTNYLTWNFTGTLQPGESIYITFEALTDDSTNAYLQNYAYGKVLGYMQIGSWSYIHINWWET